MKEFNITTNCIPEKHYMVETSKKIDEIISILIDKGKYFTINRARQYGKTTTISKLEEKLYNKYMVVSISFEGKSYLFKDEESFASGIFELFAESFRFTDKEIYNKLLQYGNSNMKNINDVSKEITRLCEECEQEIILIIDEVDKASNFIVFMDFLGELRAKYIQASKNKDKTFKSVVLAGVSDIKNLKVHMTERRVLTNSEAERLQKGEYNSPWNVAEDFLVDMSFNKEEIATMLVEYEVDYKTGMDIGEISQEIYDYTSGYPFLVSKICKVIDERIEKDFSKNGVQEAVKIILSEKGTLFDDLIKNIEHNQELYNTVYSIAIEGQELTYDVYADEKGLMYGILKKGKNGKLAIHNKIFEILIYNYMSVKKEREGKKKIINYESRSQFIAEDGNLKIVNILEKFQELMEEEYRKETEKFKEKEGRLIFLAFIKPIINGTGFYYVEAETRTNKRIDIVITYNKKEYIIELKKYYDKPREEKGYKQLADYMEIKRLDEGYMVVFSFRKDKEYTQQWLEIEGRRIYEIVV